MLRSLKHRLRQLWQQCDLFEGQDTKRSVLWTPAPETRPRRPQPSRQPMRPRPSALPVPDGYAVRSRTPRTHPQDRAFVAQLNEAFAKYNMELFGNVLRPIAIRVSRRMQNRLGHYMATTPGGIPAEIAISRRHIRRDSWDEVLHTLVHEMVHQWQDENGLPIDHGQHFRRKAREVGISARATRPMA